MLSEDFQRLMDTGFLLDVSIEILDRLYRNGIAGKHVVFLMEERPRPPAR